MKRSFIFLMLLAFLLASCSPSQEALQKALSGTQTAIALLTPTSTNTPEITSTPTETSTPTPTNTPEPTLTPTPDLRVLDGEPSDFLPKTMDLPKEPQYYLPYQSWMGRTSSIELMEGWGMDKIGAQEFIEKTGRIDSWFVNFYRGSVSVTAPELIGCSVGKHKTNAGVLIYIDEYNYTKKPFRDDSDWELYSEDISELGKHSIILSTQFYNDTGQMQYGYRVEAPYFNFYVACWGFGLKDEVTPEFMVKIVQIVIDKMKQSSLVTPMP